jgi:hypothetical protein
MRMRRVLRKIIIKRKLERETGKKERNTGK